MVAVSVWRLPRYPMAALRRNGKLPEEGAVLFTRAEMLAWVQGVKAGEFDDLT